MLRGRYGWGWAVIAWLALAASLAVSILVIWLLTRLLSG